MQPSTGLSKDFVPSFSAKSELHAWRRLFQIFTIHKRFKNLPWNWQVRNSSNFWWMENHLLTSKHSQNLVRPNLLGVPKNSSLQARLADFSLSIHTCGLDHLDHLDNLEQEAKLGHTMKSHGNLAPKVAEMPSLWSWWLNFYPAVFFNLAI